MATTLILSLHLICYQLVGQLGSLKFRERERAQAALSCLGPFSVAAIESGGLSHDPEVRHRCKRLRKSVSQMRVRGLGELPWIDTLPDNWRDRNQVIGSNLRLSAGSHTGPGFPAYREATAHFLIRLYEDGWTWDRILLLVDVMRANERWTKERYVKSGSYLWSGYPETWPPREKLPLPKEQ